MRRTLQSAITEFNGALPQAIGACSGDVATIAASVNQAQWEIILAGGETGFAFMWQKVVFNMLRCDPYLTLPAMFARIINLDVCRTPYRIQNEFYEFLPGGIGLQGGLNGVSDRADWCGAFQGFERGVFPTFIDLTPANQYLTVFLTNPADVGKSIIFQNAIDQNGNLIYEQDGTNSIVGTSLTFQQPSVTTAMIVTGFSGIQKDQTVGDILLYQTDATTGAQILLSRYTANETNPALLHQGVALHLFNLSTRESLPCPDTTAGKGSSDCVVQAGISTCIEAFRPFDCRKYPRAYRVLQTSPLSHNGFTGRAGSGAGT